MKNKRSHCLAVTLPEGLLIVVGGFKEGDSEINSVEILEDKDKERERQEWMSLIST